MAALTITAANVVAQPGATVITGTAAAAITAGQALYLDAATGNYGLADCDSATAAVREFAGIALNGASANQPVAIATRGPVALGAGTMTVGVGYYLAPTPGGIGPVADVLANDYPVFLGFATSTSIINIQPVAAGVQL